MSSQPYSTFSDSHFRHLWLLWTVYIPWISWVVVQLVLFHVFPTDSAGLLQVICWSVSVLLALASFTLAFRGTPNENRPMFVSIGLLFGLNGILGPLYCFLPRTWLLELSKFSDVYCFQYITISYFVSLSYAVLSTVISLGTRFGRGAKQLGSITLTIVICCVFFGPYLVDPLHLYRQPDISDYFAIDEVIQEMKKSGIEEYSESVVIDKVRLLIKENGKPIRTLSTDEAHLRVQELSRFLKSQYPEALFYRPLYSACVGVADVCLAFLVLFVLSSLFRDHPKGAFLEKIAWLLLPYVILEELHYRVYQVIYRRETFDAIHEIGGYLSTSVMLIMLLVFALRLKFVSSIEGRFYETRVHNNALGITRWRDMVDNWVLRQFVRQPDLNRRFLIRGEQSEDFESDNRQ